MFDNCPGQLSIIINTNSNEELERFKKLLPAEYRGKVIKNPVYAEVLAFSEESYKAILCSPQLSGLKDDFYFFNNQLPSDALVQIAGFENSAVSSYKKTILQYTFPTCQASLICYKNKVKELISSTNEKTSIDINLLSCAGELQHHLDGINRQKEIKEKKAPVFFAENPAILLEVTEKTQAILKAIHWLKGEADSVFSPIEMEILNQGIVGRTLNQYHIELPLTPGNNQLDL